jgi:putative endonuclease
MKTRALGDRGEQLAAEYLRRHGMRILARNYRTRLGEIDIIAQDRTTIALVEVKTRTSAEVAWPYESVGAHKREKLRRLALEYLARHGDEDRDIRFDVVSIVAGPGRPVIEHIPGAF